MSDEILGADVPDSRQRRGETRGGLFGRLLTELQETGKCRVATLSIVEILWLLTRAGLDEGKCYIDVAGFLYVRKGD